MATLNDIPSGTVMADSLHGHEIMELLPLQPSSTKKAQPLCRSASSCATRSCDILGGCHCLRLHAGACIDVNQIFSSPEKQDELSSVDIHFTLGLSHDTQSSQNARKRAPRSGISGRTDPDGHKNVSSFEHEGTSKGISPHVSEVDEAGGSITRKKLRLSKDESFLLEESFKKHSTLNPKQKNTLAKQLNLRPRQVEVWFQNRRARNKLKQIEVDCELLQRCCDTLTEENKRLQREVAELKELKVQGSPASVIPHDFCKLLPITTTMCPTCEYRVPCGPAVPVRTSSTTTSISSFCSEPSNLSLSFSPQQ